MLVFSERLRARPAKSLERCFNWLLRRCTARWVATRVLSLRLNVSSLEKLVRAILLLCTAGYDSPKQGCLTNGTRPGRAVEVQTQGIFRSPSKRVVGLSVCRKLETLV